MPPRGRIVLWCALALLGAIAWRIWPSRSQTASAPGTSPAAEAGRGSDKTGAAASAPAAATGDRADPARLLALAKKFTEQPSTFGVEKILRDEKDAEARKAALGELLSHRFDRDDAIRVLELALKDSDVGVRVRAAELLYTLGSAAGKQVLLDAMQAAWDAQSASTRSAAVSAASVLTRFRETIPVDLLYQLYERFPHPGLLTTMAMQGNPRYFGFLAEALERESIAGNVFNLGVLGAPEGHAIAKRIFDSAPDDRTKVAAAWAMFRTGGDRAALDFILERAAVGATKPKPADLSMTAADAISDARRAVCITQDAAARDFLRQAVSVANGSVRNSSLASLFYVQRDYEFVDATIQKFFSNPAAYPGLDHNMVWRMAAARGSPAIEQAAQAQSPDFHDRYFVRLKGRPVEGWIWSYLSEIPLR